MGQREDVSASLMRGDSRDGCARRKVADQVRDVVVEGARPHRCPFCVEFGHDPCAHGRDNALMQDGAPLPKAGTP